MKWRLHINWFGTFLLAVTILSWSLIPPMLKSLTGLLDNWTTNGVRYPFSALLLSGILWWEYRAGNIPARIWKLALIPTVFNVLAQILWAWIPYYLDATRMGFFVRVSVIASIGGGLFFFPEERCLLRHPLFWIGAVICLIGIVILWVGGVALPEGESLAGILMSIVCGICYGFYAVGGRYCMKGARPWVAFPIVSLYTSICLFTLMLVEGKPSDLMKLSLNQWGFLLLSGFIGIAMSHTLYYMAIDRLGVAVASSAQLASPFLTYYIAYTWLEERITLAQWGGGVMLFAGGVMLILSQTKFTDIKEKARDNLIEPDVSD